jgi:hypothetical protein
MQEQLSPTRALLRRLGINIPEAVKETEEQQTERDRKAKESQSQDPLWKRFARNAVEAPTSALKGLLGLDYSPDFKGAGREGATFQDYIQGASELGTSGVGTIFAGMPFLKYFQKGIIKQPYLTHGTRRTFDAFDPAKRDVNDVLGWQGMHAAERPGYSEQYSFGQTKHLGSPGTSPQTLAVQPEAKNVLDLVDPTADDMSAVLAAMSPENRTRHIERFKDARRVKEDARKIREGDLPKQQDVETAYDETRENLKKLQREHSNVQYRIDNNEVRGLDLERIKEIEEAIDFENMILNDLGNTLSRYKAVQNISQETKRHYPQGIFNEPDTATRYLADQLRMQPEEYAKTPFDAIRYRDIGEKAWAFNLDTPLKTPWGTPVSKPYTPPTVFSRFRAGREGVEQAPTVSMKGKVPTAEEIKKMMWSGKISPEESGMLKNYFNDPGTFDYPGSALQTGVKSPKGLDKDIDQFLGEKGSTVFQFAKPAPKGKFVNTLEDIPVWAYGGLKTAAAGASPTDTVMAVYDTKGKVIELMSGHPDEIVKLLNQLGYLNKPGYHTFVAKASNFGAGGK